MNNNVATISKIRQAFRALRNAVESKGDDKHSYNLMMGISFAPAKGLDADALVKAVEGNKKISADLVYGMQAGLKIAPRLKATKSQVLDEINAFEAKLAALPEDLGANMTLEFNVTNDHEQEVLNEAQKGINAITEAKSEDLGKLKVAK